LFGAESVELILNGLPAGFVFIVDNFILSGPQGTIVDIVEPFDINGVVTNNDFSIGLQGWRNYGGTINHEMNYINNTSGYGLYSDNRTSSLNGVIKDISRKVTDRMYQLDFDVSAYTHMNDSQNERIYMGEIVKTYIIADLKIRTGTHIRTIEMGRKDIKVHSDHAENYTHVSFQLVFPDDVNSADSVELLISGPNTKTVVIDNVKLEATN
jgi:hypothetical protein